MSSAMISQTLQGAVLSATSNVIAQAMSSYKENTPFTLDTTPILKFMIFSIISNPPNIVWQSFLEDLFPTNVPASLPPSEKTKKNAASKTGPTRMSKRNLLVKFVLDQTVGAVFNTLMFIVFFAYINDNGAGKTGSWGNVESEVRDKFYPMVMDGYKFWPIVSLVSFLWVPVDKRVVFGCSVGVLWGIYLSLMVAA
ncbi:hypothetical protein P280DRAFT_472992 [Massarina eburnea CBS 473.64]|uniref:Integral membrane protein-like protein n=1 Tax=Massarina eburnea CBS 473.64 TaxID=1395130 RepID=A0A6A6RPD8_9PLEO|nr:hypothetical protein P280DRAFT_472992 [Massarina eburnea CBS 473.64]